MRWRYNNWFFKKFFEENGLKKFVDFKGYVNEEELKKCFEISDVIVYPSIKMKNWEEQFGYSVLEGMSNGLASIVTDCGSLPELVGDAGIIVPQKKCREISWSYGISCKKQIKAQWI